MNKIKILVIFTALISFGLPKISDANVKILKIYREANPDLKPDCMYCHMDKAPKTDDGKHELNAYGKKVGEMLQAEKKELTDDELKAACIKIFQNIGRHDTFKATESQK